MSLLTVYELHTVTHQRFSFIARLLLHISISRYYPVTEWRVWRHRPHSVSLSYVPNPVTEFNKIAPNTANILYSRKTVTSRYASRIFSSRSGNVILRARDRCEMHTEFQSETRKRRYTLLKFILQEIEGRMQPVFIFCSYIILFREYHS